MKALTRKITVTAVMLFLPWLLISCGNKPTVIADVGFATPESVEHYVAEDVYLVTNINGSPIEADGNGFISKIKPDGSVIDLKWIDGAKNGVHLDAPKGAAIKNNVLYVADLNHVHVFELPSGEQQASIDIKGSTFLNGITPGAGNFLYVTDSGLQAGEDGLAPSGTDAIYKVWTDGQYELIVKDANMGHPNGILVHDNEILVVTFGSGEVFRTDDTGERQAMPAPPKGNLDGLLRLDDGRLLISSWGESAVYVMDKDKTYKIFAGSIDAPADMGLDTKRNRVLVPLFKQNKVVFLPF